MFSRIFNPYSNNLTVGYWNCAIRWSVHNGLYQDALLLFRQMKQSGVEPNNLTFPFVGKACAQSANLRNSQIFHTHVIKSPLASDIFVQTAMVDMYIKCGHLNMAHKLFEEMPRRDVTSWNVILMGCSQFGHSERVSALLHQMRLADHRPDCITIISLTHASSNFRNLNMMKSVHCLGVRAGLPADICVTNTWVAAYAKCDDLVSAESVFNEIPIEMRTVISWNALISGYGHFERSAEAISCFCRMRHDGSKPDLGTFIGLLSSCAREEALLYGKLIHSHLSKGGFDSDISLLNTLISMYSKCGDISSSRFLFNSMSNRTSVSWTAMIGGYARKGDLEEALSLFNEMEATNVKPDEVTVVALLTACSHSGALEVGRRINRYVMENGFGENIMVSNALIDMYVKCGSVHDAKMVFDSMSARTVVSWTTLISGCALNGKPEEAINLFSEMLNMGLKPNHLTYLAVLQACAHAGLLEKGWKFFDMMKKVHLLNPRIEHYACMADLLGRGGKVQEALEFIQTMPVQPDSGVWGSLLGACGIHNNVKVGEYAVDQLSKLEPFNAVPYVAMANLYAAERKWASMARIRATMKDKGVKKSPGRSVIRIADRVHLFTVEDRFHLTGLPICEVLDGLTMQLKPQGVDQFWIQ
ncbi:hypothetical protein H6P81_020466 [Aristolochia fimbriata]|uniref:Pentatricopeptide repeat-containing protein n=1 Tax=Aristolochia fimbriata TaxID=158543 RepID=A0AAV7DVN9_ARIFI|nr:hypothetical protein H6P81_020466 [Aristolochia fimbriata]